jgi:hypothetical protein
MGEGENGKWKMEIRKSKIEIQNWKFESRMGTEGADVKASHFMQ